MDLIGREFSKNMLVMLVAIMIGAILVTYFVADIVRQQQSQQQIDTLTDRIEFKDTEIKNVKKRNINFTNHFLRSSGVLDLAREDRANGNYNFEIGVLWYTTALSENNISELEVYKEETIDKCDKAMSNYTESQKNFETASQFFYATRDYTDYTGYLDLLNLYVNLSDSGAKLTGLRYNASLYLKYLTQNLTLDPETNTVTYETNVTGIQELYNKTTDAYNTELQDVYNEIQDQIKEYDIEGFNPFR